MRCPLHARLLQIDVAVLNNDMGWVKTKLTKLDDGMQRLEGGVKQLQRSVDLLPMKLLLVLWIALAALASFIRLVWPWLRPLLLRAWMG